MMKTKVACRKAWMPILSSSMLIRSPTTLRWPMVLYLSSGIPDVMVNGMIVVKDSKALKAVFPGKAIRLPVTD